MALINAESCLRRYLSSWHSAYTHNRTHREQPPQIRQFPSLTQVKPTANACSVCYVCSLTYLYEENTIKIAILRIQYCKVYKSKQMRFNNYKLQGPVSHGLGQSMLQALPTFSEALDSLTAFIYVLLQFTFLDMGVRVIFECPTNSLSLSLSLFSVDGYKNARTKYFA